MIARLRGTVAERRADRVVLDVGGVGYDVAVPLTTLAVLPETGSEATLHVYTHVAEGVLALYGFASQAERTVFELLIGVSGVGCSTAVALLSSMPAAEVVAAVAAGDVRRLTAARGIGKKTAERLVLELRDKFAALDLAGRAEAALRGPLDGTAGGGALAHGRGLPSRVGAEVASALVRLGFRAQEADAAVARAMAELGDQTADAARLLREALRGAQV